MRGMLKQVEGCCLAGERLGCAVGHWCIRTRSKYVAEGRGKAGNAADKSGVSAGCCVWACRKHGTCPF
jgi:hypothetical protein